MVAHPILLIDTTAFLFIFTLSYQGTASNSKKHLKKVVPLTWLVSLYHPWRIERPSITKKATERIFSEDVRNDVRNDRLRWKSARSLFWLFSVIDGRFFGAQKPLRRFFGYWWLSRLLFRSLFWLFIVEYWVKNNLRKQPKFGYWRSFDPPGVTSHSKFQSSQIKK